VRLSTNLGLPIAEPDDARRDYPTTVDGPRTDALDALIPSLSPPGIIHPYAGSTAPSGWLLCQGQAVSRTTYAALFAVCGTTYGVGDGSTTFNLPNLKGRVAVGVDSADTAFDAVGEKGGAKTHLLTTAEMPSHTHNFKQRTLASALGDYQPGAASNTGSLITVSDGSIVLAAGGGAAHNNLQPYIALHHIIKT
jgi:microcystin-dependent protein